MFMSSIFRKINLDLPRQGEHVWSEFFVNIRVGGFLVHMVIIWPSIGVRHSTSVLCTLSVPLPQ